MGMFTTIVDTNSGREYQIKCGWDNCETYKLGDKIEQWPSEHDPGEGYLLDDVYEGYDYDQKTKISYEAYIVIKDGIVKEIVPFSRDDGDDEEEKPYIPAILKEKHQITDPPREWWSEDLWKEKEDSERQVEEESKAFMASIEHLPPKERLTKMMAKLIINQLNYSSLAKSCFTVEPLDVDSKKEE